MKPIPRSVPAWFKPMSWVVLSLCLSGCSTNLGPPMTTGTPVTGAFGNVVNLSQGWSEKEQQLFWNTTQGSQLIPYDFFLALEQAGNTNLFRSNENMDRLRWLISKPTKMNPDGLPVGFVKDVDTHGQAWMGFTCAACHTAQVEYKGIGLRIDGGPTMSDAQSFLKELRDALVATGKDEAKFDRFAQRVLKGDTTPKKVKKLRQQFSLATLYVVQREERNAAPHDYGFARLDAFGNIFNEVMDYDLGLPENRKAPDAPVSFPFLWDTPQSDVVQWNGSANNKGLGPLARNTGEVLGVFARIDIEPDSFPLGYRSSAKLVNLGNLEKWVTDLWSPQWPEKYLPQIDRAKTERGQALYQQNCAGCHELINRTDPNRQITAVMIKASVVKTDETMTMNAATRTGKTGRLEGTKLGIIAGPKFGPTSSGAAMLGNAVVGAMFRHPLETVVGLLEESDFVPAAPKFDPVSYKARPLNGIWATAPYLHNGSVPNLWELLQPSPQRVKEFNVGSRELDPVKVGLNTDPVPGTFRFDTTIPGNLNTGHEYGSELSSEQKWDLIEFLKTL